MNSTMFGPSGWVVLHVGADIAVRDGWTPEQFNVYVNRLHSALSCIYCRDSFARFRQQLPMPADRRQWPLWIVRLHNLVNMKLDKQQWSKQHNQDPAQLIPAALDILFTAAVNQLISKRPDRMDALVGMVHLIRGLTGAPAPRWSADPFESVYRWVDRYVSRQRLSCDAVRRAYMYRKAKSKKCTNDVQDHTMKTCE